MNQGYGKRDERQGDRYELKRRAGISPVRADGSLTSRENDVQATAAERFACSYLGVPFRAHITVRGDDEPNARLSDGRSVDIKWLGVDARGLPRFTGNVIVNPEDKPRDLYVLVAGHTDTGFRVMGYCDREEAGWYTRDFGFGPKRAFPVAKLRSAEVLREGGGPEVPEGAAVFGPKGWEPLKAPKPQPEQGRLI